MSHEYTAVAQLEVDSEPVEPFYDRHPNENQFPFQKGLFNVLLHTFSFAILITALFPALVLQTSLHPQLHLESAGPTGLIAFFSAFAVISLVITGPIHFLTERFTILFGSFLIFPFVGVNYFEIDSTGAKAAYFILAVLAGLGFGAVLNAQAVYITRNSHISTIGRNFGIVIAGARLGEFVGSMIVSSMAKQLGNSTYLSHTAIRLIFALMLVAPIAYFGSTILWTKPAVGTRQMGQKPLQYNLIELPQLSIKLASLIYVAALSGLLQAFSILIIPKLLNLQVASLPYHWAVYGSVGIVVAAGSGFLVDILNLKYYVAILGSLGVSCAVFFMYATQTLPTDVYGLAAGLSVAQSAVDVFLYTTAAVATSSQAELSFPMLFFVKALATTLGIAFNADNATAVLMIAAMGCIIGPFLLYFTKRQFNRKKLMQ